MEYDVIIVGGGLAGLVSAVHLSKYGQKVLLIEKHKYPQHKVCGEYISNEVLPYLRSLDFDPMKFGAKDIVNFTLSTPKSRVVQTKLPLGGFSISRYCIDWELAKKALSNGVTIVHSTVTNITFQDEVFTVETNSGNTYKSSLAIGSFGKRSNLDVKMDRAFIKKKSPFLGVKAHYKGDFPADAVGLHNFEGGYCGISKVENDHINVCYLAGFEAFKKYKNIDDFQKQVLSKNKFLKEILGNSQLAFERPLTISQVSFSEKNPVENHLLMCGDTAGMIHPLAGNGMSMAISAAQMASQLILQFRNGEIKSRTDLEVKYAKRWNRAFKTRLKSGHIIAKLFDLGIFSELLMLLLKVFPFILPIVIKRTHGKLLLPEKD